MGNVTATMVEKILAELSVSSDVGVNSCLAGMQLMCDVCRCRVVSCRSLSCLCSCLMVDDVVVLLLLLLLV